MTEWGVVRHPCVFQHPPALSTIMYVKGEAWLGSRSSKEVSMPSARSSLGSTATGSVHGGDHCFRHMHIWVCAGRAGTGLSAARAASTTATAAATATLSRPGASRAHLMMLSPRLSPPTCGSTSTPAVALGRALAAQNEWRCLTAVLADLGDDARVQAQTSGRGEGVGTVATTLHLQPPVR